MFHSQYLHIYIAYKRGLPHVIHIIYSSISHYILISMHENDSIFSLFRFHTSVSNYICHGKDYSQLLIEEGQISNSSADLDADETKGRR